MQLNRVTKQLIEKGLDPIEVMIRFTQDYDVHTKEIIEALAGVDPLDVMKVKLKYDELYFRVLTELNESVQKEQEINSRFNLLEYKHKLDRQPMELEEKPVYYIPAGEEEEIKIES